MTTDPSGPQRAPASSPVSQVAGSAVQRVADASVWLLFRVTGVRS